MSVKIGVISLGCVKNSIDTEMMLASIPQECEIVQRIEDADIMIINTCAFIDPAKQESIDTILDVAEYKKKGSLKYLIVTGCLPERYRSSLRELIPEVDCFAGIAAYKALPDILKDAVSDITKDYYPEVELETGIVVPRLITTPMPTAYIKIAEGCDNHCSYCVIPSIRGPYRSRPMEDIITETVLLVQNGYNEIIFVAQETTLYGFDIYGKPMISELLKRAATVPGLKWLRLLYSYPEHVDEELVDTMLESDKIVNYLDIPVQHFSDEILRDMNRQTTCRSIEDKVSMIRSKSKDIILRTTLIAGFPGETEDDHDICCQMVNKLQFDRLGVFAYSQEDGTPAAEMPVQIDEAVKLERVEKLMTFQADVSAKRNQSRIGTTCEVLIEGYDEDSDLYYGRSYAEAPDADGKILVESSGELETGKYYNVELTYAYDFDIKGVVK